MTSKESAQLDPFHNTECSTSSCRLAMENQQDELGFETSEEFIREQMKLFAQIQQQHRQEPSRFPVLNEADSSGSFQRGIDQLTSGPRPCKIEHDSEAKVDGQCDDEGNDLSQFQKVAGEVEIDCFDRFDLSDEALIREQHRLFERIQRESSALQSQASLDLTSQEAPSYQHKLFLEGMDSLHSLSTHPTVTTESTTAVASTSTTKSVFAKPSRQTSIRDDCVTKLSNGKKLRLKGTKHAYDAISQGNAVLVRCAGCQSLLQVPQSCTAVYCSFCHDITPMDLARNASTLTLPSPPASAAPGTHGLGMVQEDESAATVMQRQELEAAAARKMAKLEAAK